MPCLKNVSSHTWISTVACKCNSEWRKTPTDKLAKFSYTFILTKVWKFLREVQTFSVTIFPQASNHSGVKRQPCIDYLASDNATCIFKPIFDTHRY